MDGRFHLDALLGHGAHGTTFRATGPDGVVAIKELPIGRATDANQQDRLERGLEVDGALVPTDDGWRWNDLRGWMSVDLVRGERGLEAVPTHHSRLDMAGGVLALVAGLAGNLRPMGAGHRWSTRENGRIIDVHMTPADGGVRVRANEKLGGVAGARQLAAALDAVSARPIGLIEGD